MRYKLEFKRYLSDFTACRSMPSSTLSGSNIKLNPDSSVKLGPVGKKSIQILSPFCSANVLIYTSLKLFIQNYCSHELHTKYTLHVFRVSLSSFIFQFHNSWYHRYSYIIIWEYTAHAIDIRRQSEKQNQLSNFYGSKVLSKAHSDAALLHL